MIGWAEVRYNSKLVEKRLGYIREYTIRDKNRLYYTVMQERGFLWRPACPDDSNTIVNGLSYFPD